MTKIQMARALEEIAALLREGDAKEDKFSFSLVRKMGFDNLSDTYKDNLRAYIDSKGKPLSFEEFESSCEMKGYKYKNFKAAYDKWTKDMKGEVDEYSIH
jgi:hypothetical protein